MNRIALSFLLLAPVWVLPRAECSAFTLVGKYLAARFATDYRALGITLTNIYRAVLAVGEDVRPVRDVAQQELHFQRQLQEKNPRRGHLPLWRGFVPSKCGLARHDHLIY